MSVIEVVRADGSRRWETAHWTEDGHQRWVLPDGRVITTGRLAGPRNAHVRTWDLSDHDADAAG